MQETPHAHDHTLCTQQIKLFQGLPQEMQEQIVTNAHHTMVPAGENVVSEGDRADVLYIVLEGKVKRSRYDAEGKELILDIYIPGEVVGEDAFLIKETFDYSIQAITPAKLCQISKASLRELLASHSAWGLDMITLLSQRLHEANARVQLLMENNAQKRVAGFLLARDERLQGGTIALTIDDIAGSTNLRRETVSRKITELQDLGLIQRRGQKQIDIIDRSHLFELFLES